jgi:hypothetical protein
VLTLLFTLLFFIPPPPQVLVHKACNKHGQHQNKYNFYPIISYVKKTAYRTPKKGVEKIEDKKVFPQLQQLTKFVAHNKWLLYNG